jgi:hypothetical protein
VLIGDDDKALLCDFDLYRLKHQVTAGVSKTVAHISIDNPFWMSPECLGGKEPEPPSDTYSFGMVIFEVGQQHLICPLVPYLVIIQIYASQPPWSTLDRAKFLAFVARGGKPERPQEGFAIPDDLWNLAEQCWAQDPNKRPSVNVLRRTLLVQHTILHEPLRILRDPPVSTQVGNETHQQLAAFTEEVKVLSLKVKQGREEFERAQKQFRQELAQEKDRCSKAIQAAENRAQENARAIQQLQYENSANIDLLASQGKLLESRTQELTVAQPFLTTADSLPGADVIRMVKKLNDEILQYSAHLAESLSKIRPQQIDSAKRNAAQSQVWELGPGIFELLENFRTTADPSITLQIAFQTCFNYSCAHIIGSWHREERLETAFKGLYHELRQTGELLCVLWHTHTHSRLDSKCHLPWLRNGEP